MWRNIVPKQKPYAGKYYSNLQCSFIKKTTKLNSQPAQYEEKKNQKGLFWKKNNKNTKKFIQGNIVVIHNILFKITKLNSQSVQY